MPNAASLPFSFLFPPFLGFLFYPEARTAVMQASEQEEDRLFPMLSPGVSQ
jgi:hypothetical protein